MNAQRRMLFATSVAISLVVLGLSGCSKSPQGAAPPPPEVIVLTVQPQSTPLSVDIVSDLKAFREVELRPRVSGMIMKQNFQPGQKVQEGDTLFIIDPRAFDEAVLDAQAKLAESEAVLARARQDVERYKPLLPDNAIPRQTYDQAVAYEQQSQAVVEARRAALEKARLDRSYAEVRSPVSGQIGLQKAEVGALASAGQTVLATVSTLDPLIAYFGIPETDYLRLAREHQFTAKGQPPAVHLILADGGAYDQPGRIDFADRAVNPTTGTLTLRAVFANPDGMLRPGMSTRVRIVYEVAQNALLVPQRAVSEMLGKTFLTVIGSDDKAEQRAVRTGPRVGDLWLIAEGLKPGERIVVDGLQKARPGTRVKPVTAPVPSEVKPAAAKG